MRCAKLLLLTCGVSLLLATGARPVPGARALASFNNNPFNSLNLNFGSNAQASADSLAQAFGDSAFTDSLTNTITQSGPGFSGSGSNSQALSQSLNNNIVKVPGCGNCKFGNNNNNFGLYGPQGNFYSIPTSSIAGATADSISQAFGANAATTSNTNTQTFTGNGQSGSLSSSDGTAQSFTPGFGLSQAAGSANAGATASGLNSFSNAQTYTKNTAGPGGASSVSKSSSQSGSQG